MLISFQLSGPREGVVLCSRVDQAQWSIQKMIRVLPFKGALLNCHLILTSVVTSIVLKIEQAVYEFLNLVRVTVANCRVSVSFSLILMRSFNGSY